MSSKANFNEKINLNKCPFWNACELPKIDFLCKVPECMNCTEYRAKGIRIIKYKLD